MIGSLLEEAFASSYGNRQGPKPSFLTESEQQGGHKDFSSRSTLSLVFKTTIKKCLWRKAVEAQPLMFRYAESPGAWKLTKMQGRAEMRGGRLEQAC